MQCHCDRNTSRFCRSPQRTSHCHCGRPSKSSLALPSPATSLSTWATWKTSAATIPITRLSLSGSGMSSITWTLTGSPTCTLTGPTPTPSFIRRRWQPHHLHPSSELACKDPLQNGAGSGDSIWKLGYQGDFALLNSDGSTDTNPFDWFYAQHGPYFTTTNTAGQFSPDGLR